MDTTAPTTLATIDAQIEDLRHRRTGCEVCTPMFACGDCLGRHEDLLALRRRTAAAMPTAA